MAVGMARSVERLLIKLCSSVKQGFDSWSIIFFHFISYMKNSDNYDNYDQSLIAVFSLDINLQIRKFSHLCFERRRYDV